MNYKVDNRWVVPYNPFLLRALGVHCNVEICMSIKAIKYVIKYVHKGNDQSSYAVTENRERDEISEYQSARYVSASEALWRIFNFPIHNRHPAVTSLPVHLPDQQSVYYSSKNAEKKVVYSDHVNRIL